jgi:hypothetical protein
MSFSLHVGTLHGTLLNNIVNISIYLDSWILHEPCIKHGSILYTQLPVDSACTVQWRTVFIGSFTHS